MAHGVNYLVVNGPSQWGLLIPGLAQGVPQKFHFHGGDGEYVYSLTIDIVKRGSGEGEPWEIVCNGHLVNAPSLERYKNREYLYLKGTYNTQTRRGRLLSYNPNEE